MTWAMVPSHASGEWIFLDVYLQKATITIIEGCISITIILTWPYYSSGLCACTYHVFYNSPFLASIVAAQAGLTVVGNTCMALAAYRIFAFEAAAEEEKNGKRVDFMGMLLNKYEEGNWSAEEEWMATMRNPPVAKNSVPLKQGAAATILDLTIKATLLAPAVKYGELYVWYIGELWLRGFICIPMLSYFQN